MLKTQLISMVLGMRMFIIHTMNIYHKLKKVGHLWTMFIVLKKHCFFLICHCSQNPRMKPQMSTQCTLQWKPFPKPKCTPWCKHPWTTINISIIEIIYLILSKIIHNIKICLLWLVLFNYSHFFNHLKSQLCHFLVVFSL
jgi:hypothetical protein